MTKLRCFVLRGWVLKMESLLETVRELNERIQELLRSKNMDEAEFLRMYAKSKSVQIAFAMGSRSMATVMAQNVMEYLTAPEEEEE